MTSFTQEQVQRDAMHHQSVQGLPHQTQNGQRQMSSQQAPPDHCSFLNGYNETKRYTVMNLIGKGSYGVVCSAKDNLTGEVVAIKKIQNVFDNVADAHRILREITLLRLLKHPDIVEIKHIMLPADPNTFKDLYVVFELMESDLHTVIGANDDLTRDHHKVFLYQLLRGLNFMHTNNVLHRDLKPKNILANSNCKLKICDFGLARPIMGNMTALTPVLWTDYVATRWYRAPELCGCFYGRYTSAVDMWSIGCIFAEVLLGRPLFPGRDAVSQLQLITDLLGKPLPSVIEGITNSRARNFLQGMPHKESKPLTSKFPSADPLALDLLSRLLAFDPADRPSAAEALSHQYFSGLPEVRQESVPVAANFGFENREKRLSEIDVRHLIYWEALQYHPHVRKAYEAQLAAMRCGQGGIGVRLPCPTASPYTIPSTPVETMAAQFLKQQSDSQDSGESTESDISGAMQASAPLQAYVMATTCPPAVPQGVMPGPGVVGSQMWRYPAIPPQQKQMQPQPQPIIPPYAEVQQPIRQPYAELHHPMMPTMVPEAHYYAAHGPYHPCATHPSQQHYPDQMMGPGPYHRAQHQQQQQAQQRTPSKYGSGPSYGAVGPPFRPPYPY
ncbi:hypothetical protein VaNZ11_013244 [Volvox africanus]|uniref:Protein kinase domain-containing protein n=1 Tax=Volvox africanus TaxID=51714 RepID=A0ABQ5SHF6_9CHLO|nr:hypothetical protein VaNZ11_013244 [Volvox africanus]